MLFSRSKSRHDSLCKLCHWHRCSTIFNHGFIDRTLLSSLDIYRIAGTASHDVQCVCVFFWQAWWVYYRWRDGAQELLHPTNGKSQLCGTNCGFENSDTLLSKLVDLLGFRPWSDAVCLNVLVIATKVWARAALRPKSLVFQGWFRGWRVLNFQCSEVRVTTSRMFPKMVIQWYTKVRPNKFRLMKFFNFEDQRCLMVFGYADMFFLFKELGRHWSGHCAFTWNTGAWNTQRSSLEGLNWLGSEVVVRNSFKVTQALLCIDEYAFFIGFYFFVHVQSSTWYGSCAWIH